MSLDLADPFQHGSPGPSVRYGHVPEGRLSTETAEAKAPHQFSAVPLNVCRNISRFQASPRSLGVQMVDVIRHGVVLKHRQVFLPEVGPDGLNQHRP